MKRGFLVIGLIVALLVAACSSPPPKVELVPDASFGDGGVAVAPAAGDPQGGDVPTTILSYENRLILAGYGCAAPTGVCQDKDSFLAAVWGLNTSGEVDSSFANGGVFADGNAAGGGKANFIFTGSVSGGDLLLAGGGKNSDDNLDGVIWALNAGGSLDTARFTAGKQIVKDTANAGEHDFVEAMRLTDGYIWLAGGVKYPADAGKYKPAIWRLDYSGSPDTAYDADGIFVDEAIGDVEAWLNDLLVLDGGKQVAVGDKVDSGVIPTVWKVLPGGGLDTSFGDGGRVSLPIPVGGGGEALSVAQDGDYLVVAGYVTDSSAKHLTLWRLRSDGQLDSGFGSGGQLVLAGNSPAVYLDHRVRLKVDERGRYWLVGGLQNAAGNSDMAVWRILADGKLDPNFCSGAPCTFGNAAGGSGDDWGNDITFAGGSVYVGGWSWDGSRRAAVVWKLDLAPAK